jgi:3-oxoacyl-[acyl-carrier protein] reductase
VTDENAVPANLAATDFSAPDFLGYAGIRAVVTGAGSGIGRAITIRLAEFGADVVLVGRNIESLQETIELAAHTGAACHAVQGDLSVEFSVERLVEDAVQSLGGLDLLVNGAAKLHREPSDESVTDEETWGQVMQTNLRAPYLLSMLSAPYLRERQGSIVNISSIWAHIGARKQVAYSTSKAALIEMTRSLALDLAPDRIRVNCVCPSTTRTPLIYRGRSEFPEADVAKAHPLGRIGEPDDVANAVLFLGSAKAAGWITGTSLTVDGGYTIQ